MNFFGTKKTSDGLLGIDIGAGGMKVVELGLVQGRATLRTYGYAHHTSEEPLSLIDDPQRAATLMREIQQKAGMKAVKVNASLPSQHVFHTIVTVPQPKGKKESLRPMIEAQVKKVLPKPIEEMILDSTVIDKHLLPKETEEKSTKKKSQEQNASKDSVDHDLFKKRDQKHIRVLVSGAPRDLVQKYVDLFKLCKLELASLETESFALIRSLVGKDPSRILIVDIGQERTNINIVEKGIPFLHRSVKAGGMNVTKAISKQMQISLTQAEQVKTDLAHTTTEQGMPPIIRESVMPILHEIKYALELYAQQDFHENSTVEKIILTGGSAHLPFLDPFLTEALNMNVYVGNPWARVALPQGSQDLLSEVGPRFSVATGLAMSILKNA